MLVHYCVAFKLLTYSYTLLFPIYSDTYDIVRF